MRARTIGVGGVLAVAALHAACGSSDSSGNGNASSSGGASSGGASSSGSTSSSGGPIPAGPVNLCEGLVMDKDPHPMTDLAKPALYATVTDAEFKTTIRRITEAPQTGDNPGIRPMYSTVSTWNADESMMILYNLTGQGHQLYDGKTYKLIRGLDELNPADIEQIYWSTTDPDILYLVEKKDFIKYHVREAQKETLTTFSFCSSNASGGDDPMFTSFDSKFIGLKCGGTVFTYDIQGNAVVGQQSINENPAQVAPSGTLAYLSDSGRVTDINLNVLRTLDIADPAGHASLGRWPTGADYWAGAVYDPGKNNDDVGNLVVFDLTNGQSKTIIGPKTGFPYPPDNHVSSLAYKQPGWAVVSTYGDTSGKGLLDLEMLVANTADGTVCRVGRHRSWGKANTKLKDSYWAEAHSVPSPSGTRIAFASDWGNGATVDTYVLELPSYKP
jgi:hypothetical protein